MDQTQTKQLLQQVRDGKISVENAVLQLKTAPFEDLGFAKVDHHRALRQGAAEVIYGSGKTPDQIVKIAESLLSQGAETVLVTRIAAETAREIEKQIALQYFDTARIGITGSMPAPNYRGAHRHRLGRARNRGVCANPRGSVLSLQKGTVW